MQSGERAATFLRAMTLHDAVAGFRVRRCP
jgi:hypothetical protein